MKKTIILTILSIVLISCSQKQKYKTITVKDKYTIDLPEFLSEGKDLHHEASLQYQNLFKEFYVIIIDERKADFPNPEEMDLNAYTSIVKEGMESSIEESVISPIRDTLINGIKAKLFSLSGKLSGTGIYYEFAYLESNKNFYQIMTWTLLKKKHNYKEEMKRMLTSFKEIKTRGK